MTKLQRRGEASSRRQGREANDADSKKRRERNNKEEGGEGKGIKT